MNKALLQRDIAESGYNIGYAAKKHLATFDIVEKAPGWISIASFAFGILAFVDKRFDHDLLAAFLLVVAYAIFYFNSYQDGRARYADAGSRLTGHFTALRSLYYEVQSRPDNAAFDDAIARLRTIVEDSQLIGISKQIFLSDWYAHYKFFWQAERSWLKQDRPFTFWRDQMPLSATVTIVVVLLTILAWVAHRMHWVAWA